MKPIHQVYSSRIKENHRQTDLDDKTVNRWENGHAKPSPLAMKQIEDLLPDLGEKGRDLLLPRVMNGEIVV